MNHTATSPRVDTGEAMLPGIASKIFSLPAGLCIVTLATAFLCAFQSAVSATIIGLAAELAILCILIRLTRDTTPALTRGLYVLYFALLVGWVLLISSQQVSDFGVYFRCGAEYWKTAPSPRAWMKLCESAWLPGSPTYWRRSLLYTFPIGIISNGSYFALKIFNAAFHLFAVAALYRLVCRHIGKSQGVLAAATLAIYPEFWFATPLATSDNLTILLIVIWLDFLLACLTGNASPKQIVVTALLALALDLLRDIGLVCVMATAILAITSEPSRRLRLAVLSALTLCFMIAIARLGAYVLPAHPEQAGMLARLVGNGITNTNPWLNVYGWIEYVYPLLPPRDHGRYLAGLISMDIGHGIVAAFHNWLAKTQVLFHGDGYYRFSGAPFDANPDNFGIRGITQTYFSNEGVAAFLTGSSAAFAAAALPGVVRLKNHGLGKVCIAFCSAFLFLVIGFGESQPRYNVLIAPALSIMIAGTTLVERRALRKLTKDVLCVTLAFITALIVGFLAVESVARFALASKVVARHFHQEEAKIIDEKQCNVEKASVSIQERYVLIHMPPTQPACYSFLLSVTGQPGDVRYYVMREPIPAQWEAPPLSAISIKVMQSNVARPSDTATLSLNNLVAIGSEVPLTRTRQASVRIMLNVAGDNDRSPHDLLFGYLHDKFGNPIKLTP